MIASPTVVNTVYNYCDCTSVIPKRQAQKWYVAGRHAQHIMYMKKKMR